MGSAPPTTPSGAPAALHAPWRLTYLRMLSSGPSADSAREGDEVPESVCFLRRYWLTPQHDAANHVIVRTGSEHRTPGAGGLIMLNAYPYSNGHLLVCLGESRQRLLEYAPAHRAELWSLVDLAVELCERALGCQGVNVGLNQGLAAGAGVPEHVHVHVVPRWQGDVNFVTTVANIRVIPSALDEMAKLYREAWAAVRPRVDQHTLENGSEKP
ncbi:MAG: HIT domain-containing protein [Planctomycetota bacterium]